MFLSGSGLQDREGYAGGIDLGSNEILERLTREGFLVLRVDDRGAGQSTGRGRGRARHAGDLHRPRASARSDSAPAGRGQREATGLGTSSDSSSLASSWRASSS